MNIRIRNERDFWSGAVFLATGVGFAWGAFAYNFGDAAQPGPGYFPFGLGVLLAALGIFVGVRALVVDAEGGGKIGHWPAKPVVTIVGAVALFGWTLPHLGLFVAMPLLVMVTALAGDEFHWGEALLNAAILTVGCWALFAWALKLTLPLWPVFLGR